VEESTVICCRAVKMEIFFGLKSQETAGDWVFLRAPKWWAPGSSAPILQMQEWGLLETVLFIQAIDLSYRMDVQQ
jgi:hypothetical protein